MHTSFSTPILEEQATHKSLPKEMFAPKPLLFVKKLLICFSITAIAILPIILNSKMLQNILKHGLQRIHRHTQHDDTEDDKWA
jgi:hypothetical protein